MTMMPLFAPYAASLLLLAASTAHAKNMNGGPYLLANTQPVSGDTPNGVYTTEYDTEYFDVFSPLIKTRYSEVYWTGSGAVPLPDEIRQRFVNATMAIVGYEVDQVKKGANGEDDVSVPITHAYNHHYYGWIQNSKKARHVQKEATEAQIKAGLAYHGHYYETAYLEAPPQAGDIPALQVFSEANGGEFRRSHHGYPKGFAQLIHAPTDFFVTPMQIDTWNRTVGDAPNFMPGPLPQSSRIPASAGYSGLIECPCSDRLKHESHQTYLLSVSNHNNDKCETPVQNATECWRAAQGLVPASQIRHHENDQTATTAPLGCSLEQHADGSMDVYWRGSSADTTTSTKGSDGQVVAFASGPINVSVAMTPSQQVTTVTLVGPADRWFGLGLGADSMCLKMDADECVGGGPYAILVAGDAVEERKLDYHGPGVVLPPSVTVVSNTVTGENRTVVLTRAWQGPDAKYFVFDPTQKQIPIILARGCSLTFAQHCGHGPAKLNFVAMDQPTHVCQGEVQSSIGGRVFGKDRCAKYPESDLLVQKNPTCFAETYRGGLTCCRHGQSLLDQEQEIPWKDQYLEYQLKFRFYFEEYQPPQVQQEQQPTSSKKPAMASHKNLHRLYRQTEANAGEYDIVQCPEGTPPSQCVQVITSQWQAVRMVEGADWKKVEAVELIYAGPHCHAPSCISMELYLAETGQLLCHVEPVFGVKDDTVMDERNFLALPPCLWGTEDNLADPIRLPANATLLSIKKNNATLPHTGEMASWQMRGYVYMKKDDHYDEILVSVEAEKEAENALVVDDEDKFEMQTKKAIRRRRRKDE